MSCVKIYLKGVGKRINVGKWMSIIIYIRIYRFYWYHSQH
jgi:hypothetical protein